MKIDDSLEHPWIKVSCLIHYFPVVSEGSAISCWLAYGQYEIDVVT